MFAKDLFIGMKCDRGAAAVWGRTDLGNWTQRDAAGEALLVKLAIAGDFDNHGIGERVDNRGADPMQAAGGLIGFAREFTTGMQGAQDHLKSGFVGKPRMRVNRNAAPIIADGYGIICMEFDFDAICMAGHRLIHGVVQNLSHQVVQGPLIGAADIHAGPLAHRLETLQHLNRGGIIIRRCCRR